MVSVGGSSRRGGDDVLGAANTSGKNNENVLPLPETLVTEQLYLYSRSIDDSFIVQKVLRPSGIALRRVTYLQLTEGILEMVKAGMGVSALPTWSIASWTSTATTSGGRASASDWRARRSDSSAFASASR